MGTPSTYTTPASLQKQDKFLYWLSRYPHVGAACLKAGCTFRQYKHWMAEAEDFRGRCEDALAEAHGRIVSEAFDAALGAGEFENLDRVARARILVKLMTEINPELTGRITQKETFAVQRVYEVFTKNVPLPQNLDELPEGEIKEIAD